MAALRLAAIIIPSRRPGTAMLRLAAIMGHASLLRPLAAATAAVKVPSRNHPLLSCEGDEFMAAFRDLVVAATPASSSPCSAAGDAYAHRLERSADAAAGAAELEVASRATAAAVEKAVALAVDDTGGVASAAVAAFRRGIDFWHLCAALELGDDLSMRPPCPFGWLTAHLCIARVLRDSISGRWPAADRWIDNDDLRHVMLSRQDIPNLVITQMVYGVSKFLTLVESSGWPVRFSDVLEFLPADRRGLALDETAIAIARDFIASTSPSLSSAVALKSLAEKGGAIEIRVWGATLHASLAKEMESVWSDLKQLRGVSVDSTFVMMQSYCAVGARDQCTRSGALWDLMQRNIDFSALSVNRHNHFPIIKNASALQCEFLEIAPSLHEMRVSDALFCFEPAYLCALFLALDRQPVIGFVGNPIGTYLHAEDQVAFYDLVARVTQENPLGKRRLVLTFTSAQLAAQTYWQTGAMSTVMRPMGRYTEVTHRVITRNVLITKYLVLFYDFACLFNHMAVGSDFQFVMINELDDRSWSSWAGHRAAVVLPYETTQLVVYELYSMGVPILMPALALLPLFFRRGLATLQDVAHRAALSPESLPASAGAAWGSFHEEATWSELEWWALFSEMGNLPGILTWSSIADVMLHLSPSRTTMLQQAQHSMRRATEEAFVRALDFWHATFVELT